MRLQASVNSNFFALKNNGFRRNATPRDVATRPAEALSVGKVCRMTLCPVMVRQRLARWIILGMILMGLTLVLGPVLAKQFRHR